MTVQAPGEPVPALIKNRTYLFLYVNMIPMMEPIKTKGANLTNKNSTPCSMVPATAYSGLL